MAYSDYAVRTRIPHPDGKSPDDDVEKSELKPVYVVVDASQLPFDFLQPSLEKRLVIGFDCEGVDLCRHGTLCLMQLAFPDAIYLVDATVGGENLIKVCKPALESTYITKVIHDCKRDSEALYYQYGIKLNNVVDTQIAYSLLEEQEGRKRLADGSNSLVNLLADPRYCDISYTENEEVRILLEQDPNIWTRRPLDLLIINAAVDDVRFLLYLYHKMMVKLNEPSLSKLSVRSSLYCRCFCTTDDGDQTDWPAVPDGITEDRLSLFEWSPGLLEATIEKGFQIEEIKSEAEIIMGGERGPPDKIFLIGSMSHIRDTVRYICSEARNYGDYNVSSIRQGVNYFSIKGQLTKFG